MVYHKKKKDELLRQLEAVEKELQSLSTFRKTPELQKFIRQLHGERSYIKRQMEQATNRVCRWKQEREERLARAQYNRSEKNKRNWRFVEAISYNYDIPVKKVRSELKKTKEGLKSDI